MSYSNNWLESISEAYKSKAKKNEKAYVKEDTETLLAIIEMLCEELDIDAEELLLEAIEQIDELSKGTYGSYIKRAAANIDYEKTDTNPENEESVEKKVRRRLKGIGRAVKALGGQHRGAKKVSEAIEQIDEADGNPAPYGYHVKTSPSGRKRYIPKTQKEWEKESAEFHAKNPDHWERMEAFQKANPLNPDLDDHITGPDDHLPGGVGKKARAERQAAIAAHRAK